jgi:assimilatory nitrate reductase catalytic subunit
VETRSTCGYCGVGCGVVIEHDGEHVTGVRGDPDHPANFGRLCAKGQALHLTMTPSAMRFRARTPLVRTARAAPFAPAGWTPTLEMLADRFANCIAEHGPDSVAFYISGQLTTEDYYVFNKLAKGLIGTNNVDTNSRLCMSSAVAGYKMTLGADAPPCCYEDLDDADVVLIAGSNTAWAHPVLYRRLEAARAQNPQLKVIVVDPRRTATAADADLHLAIEPGTDVALFHGLLHVLLWEELIDPAWIARHTSGFAELKSIIREFTPRAAAQICGVREEDLVTAARWFGHAGAALSLYCQGLNQSTAGTAKNAALINLHLATGQIGRPGAGPFSLTGQPNAMGGREVGGMATLLSAHRDLADPAHRAEVAKLWGVDRVPDRPGHTAVELFEALAAGTVKMVWIACTNPAQSLPDQRAVRAGLERAELVVLQEVCTDTETAAYADVLLPGAGWAEKEGTVTNSERRITRVRAAVPAPGEARGDWAIATAFAQALEARLRPGLPTLFPYLSVADVFAEHVKTTVGRDLDIGGLSHARLDESGPQQWPFPAGATSGRARLYGDGCFPTADGRARFAAVPYKPVAEPVNAHYPFKLMTGRLRDQWHGMSRTGTVASLHAHAPEPALSMHPFDLERRGLAAGDLASIRSKRGELIVPLAASDELRPGHAFLPMHWGGATLTGADAMGINVLTTGASCPQSKQPELKHAAVRIARAELPQRLVAFGQARDDDAVATRAALRQALSGVAYASVVMLSGPRPGVLVRAAAAEPFHAALLEKVDAALGLTGDDIACYDDPRRGIGRRLRQQDARIAAVRMSGDVGAEAWLRDAFDSGDDVSALRTALLTPGARPPGRRIKRSALVCTCFGVTEDAIRACPGDLAHVQSELKCGTNCGSCLPELRRLVAARPDGMAA